MNCMKLELRNMLTEFADIYRASRQRGEGSERNSSNMQSCFAFHLCLVQEKQKGDWVSLEVHPLEKVSV